MSWWFRQVLWRRIKPACARRLEESVLLGFMLALSDVAGLDWKGEGLFATVVAGSFGGTYLIARVPPRRRAHARR
ncbi:hypothetical protein ACFY5D_01380 [Paeniglutamicibacter sp. NPDC012692]|uniref:hypothetical protein n=1 Tax=Paeniglutamicibacter sp. NPDC012692 TaxID=3364388 RepID=UPI00369DD84A